jgi:hypothetical protein
MDIYFYQWVWHVSNQNRKETEVNRHSKFCHYGGSIYPLQHGSIVDLLSISNWPHSCNAQHQLFKESDGSSVDFYVAMKGQKDL